jgi:hypothetical protein
MQRGVEPLEPDRPLGPRRRQPRRAHSQARSRSTVRDRQARSERHRARPSQARPARHRTPCLVSPARDDSGAAVEFVLVGVLVCALFLGILEIGLALHVRNTLVACAAEGARYAANADPATHRARIAPSATAGSARRRTQHRRPARATTRPAAPSRCKCGPASRSSGFWGHRERWGARSRPRGAAVSGRGADARSSADAGNALIEFVFPRPTADDPAGLRAAHNPSRPARRPTRRPARPAGPPRPPTATPTATPAPPPGSR